MAYLGPPPARTPVTSDQITDASVTADKLATNAVTAVKITAANVTTAKIADDAVTTDKVGALTTLATNVITETTGGTGVTIDGVLVKDTGVATDDIILAGTKLLAVRFHIQNASGTLVHYTYNVSNQAVNVGSYTGGINGLSATITTTPTGTDSSTNFATGAKVGSATTSYVWFDTGAVSNTCYFTGHILENRASPSAPLNADFNAQNLNINGTTRVRLVISHKLDTGAVFAINTTNIASGKLIAYNINGFMEPA